MITTTIEIKYFVKNFRENNIASEVYGILIDNKLGPESVHTSFWESRSCEETRYIFDGNIKLSCVSDKLKLEERLGIKLDSLKITHR